jgi:hypothetical protein
VESFAVEALAVESLLWVLAVESLLGILRCGFQDAPMSDPDGTQMAPRMHTSLVPKETARTPYNAQTSY